MHWKNCDFSCLYRGLSIKLIIWQRYSNIFYFFNVVRQLFNQLWLDNKNWSNFLLIFSLCVKFDVSSIFFFLKQKVNSHLSFEVMTIRCETGPNCCLSRANTAVHLINHYPVTLNSSHAQLMFLYTLSENTFIIIRQFWSVPYGKYWPVNPSNY